MRLSVQPAGRITALVLQACAVFAFLFTASPSAHAQAVIEEAPATYTGAMGCPSGSFLDIGRGDCWSCPPNAPARTIFAVTSADACEAPLHEEFRRATGPKNPTGLIHTDCQPGWFLDIGLGKCYSCNGYNRTAYPISNPRACSRLVPARRARAKLERASAYCPPGSFQHLLTGRCYSCPPDMDRNLRTGADPSTFNACSLTEAGKARRLGLAKAEELAPQMVQAMLASLTLSNDSSTTTRLKNHDDALAADAERATGANPCALDAFNTWSLGGTADVNAIIGAALDTGMAVDIRKPAREGRTPQRNAYWYGAVSYSIGLNAGGSAGVNYGCWIDDNNHIGGDYHGFVFDPLEIGELATALKAAKGGEHLKDAFKTSGASLAFGVWFDYDWRFLGVTMTPAYGRGISIGGYSKGTTLQIP
ncbi:MAG: hypothetical protein GC155_10795 [Alphaproteobacteria bacterium]|nr:hypothetical protein [Alphaproteobacteria bacterium]